MFLENRNSVGTFQVGSASSSRHPSRGGSSGFLRVLPEGFRGRVPAGVPVAFRRWSSRGIPYFAKRLSGPTTPVFHTEFQGGFQEVLQGCSRGAFRKALRALLQPSARTTGSGGLLGGDPPWFRRSSAGGCSRGGSGRVPGGLPGVSPMVLGILGRLSGWAPGSAMDRISHAGLCYCVLFVFGGISRR